MTTGKRKVHSADIKAKVALEAVKGVAKVNEIAQRFDVQLIMVRQWKKSSLVTQVISLLLSAAQSQPSTPAKRPCTAKSGA